MTTYLRMPNLGYQLYLTHQYVLVFLRHSTKLTLMKLYNVGKQLTNPSLDPGLHHPRPGVFHAGPLQHHLRPQHRPPTQLRDHAYAAQGPGILLRH